MPSPEKPTQYVFDTTILIDIFRYYYFDRFPSFWKMFFEYVEKKVIISVKEVYHEILDGEDHLVIWAKENKSFFVEPSVPEMEFVTKIYSIPHFQQNLERKKLMKGGPFADPFLIARAKISNAVLVTKEKYKENGAKIPNICKHFGIECIDFEGFLVKENWKF